MIAETYKNNNKVSPSAQTTKKQKTTEDSPSPLSPKTDDNNMVIDDKNEMENPIPIDEQSNDFKSRTKPTYVVTGIPLNANVLDMLPLTNHLRARSIKFLPTKAASLHKVANIYCNTKDAEFELYNKFDTNFQGFQLHVFPAQGFILNNTCGYCGKCPHLQDNSTRYKPDNYGHNYHNHNNPNTSSNSYNHTKGFNPRPKKIPTGHLDNWDKPLQRANTSLSSTKVKQSVAQEPPNVDLINRINHLETIIKDISSEIGGLNIVQKQHKEDITLLKEQQQLNVMNMEKLNQQLNTINTTMIEQTTTISGVPKIVSFIKSMEQNGFFSQFNNYNNDQAYGTENYAYPPHNEFVDERLFNDEHNDSNSGYESSSTVKPMMYFQIQLIPHQDLQGGLMIDKTKNILQRLRNTVTNISFSFNLKSKKPTQKYQKNSDNFTNQKKDNNIINFSSSSSTNVRDPNNNISIIDEPSHQSGFLNYSEIISDYKQLVFATHNIKGGFQKKKDNIIAMMIEQHIDFLHICETNEHDNNFDISKSKAHIKYITPINNEFSNIFFIINNPNEHHNSTVNFQPIHPPSLTDQPNLNSLPNTSLIMKLFDDVRIVEDLQGISLTLSPFSHLEFFSDGFFEPTNSQVGHSMGYGWTTSNLTNVNITYNGSVKFFPSSTKAETMAILTALVVCPE
ncbi:hypothetical protein RhiirC2_778277 [Rhizophagus irregularis]|uniref:Uncharacterized protein n=1 Tax=Rhizophagus irregularis TaxID=588596 RepID=A0A2N1NCC5_9GLOM|nr:hypothetical protein RhiirC2_778277 [Rhizophagus irregularis]